MRQPFFVHESALVDEGAVIGEGTHIWHFSHVMSGARIGSRCNLGQNVFVAAGVIVGNNVKIQNNVSLYSGTVLEDDVFLGPSCVFTNVSNPRSAVRRHHLFEQTVVRRGATVGANATIVCGVEIGKHAFVGAGAVVTRPVLPYALVLGVPATRVAWMSRHGHRLENPDSEGILTCPESGLRYREIDAAVLRCLDLEDDEPLPVDLARGKARRPKRKPSL
jgi:UDP-2-acetamido-3-amino-2,3-dideoxy-glucuronate N-acetyltransferase